MQKLAHVAAVTAFIALVADPAWSATFNVNVGNFFFVDVTSATSTSTIAVGDTVHWVWGASNHSTTSGACNPGCVATTTGEHWDSGVLSSGSTFNYTFTTPGTYPYFCKVHLSSMQGTVVVKDVVNHYSVSAPASAVAGTPVLVTVTALDASNQTVPGYTGTAQFTSSDILATLPADYTFTGADAGAHTFSVTLATVGNQTITATDISDGSITGSAGVAVEKTTVLSYHTIAPCRLVDTRNGPGTYGGPALTGSGATRAFSVVGQCGLPSGVMAVAGNVTAINPPATGDLRFFATGTTAPNASMINFKPGSTRANNLTVPVSGVPAGSFTVQNDAAGPVNVVIDVVGYFD